MIPTQDDDPIALLSATAAPARDAQETSEAGSSPIPLSPKALARALNRTQITGISALAYQLEMLSENYRLLTRLLGSSRDFSGRYLAFVDGQVPLWLEVIEQQAHTTVLRLSHSYRDSHPAQARTPLASDLPAVSLTRDLPAVPLTRDLPAVPLTRDLAPLSLEPNAWVRIYHDSQQAEVTHFALPQASTPAKRVSPRELAKHKLRLGGFFQRWLEHLLRQGFAAGAFQAVDTLPDQAPTLRF